MDLQGMKEFWEAWGFTFWSDYFDHGKQFGIKIDGHGVSHAVRFKIDGDEPTKLDLLDAHIGLKHWLRAKKPELFEEPTS